ncbi:hypothetical protein BVX94_03565 [bacterium B17]|nr:hypothetical protein BVX94_03565 [bacterium B17]
MVTKDKKEIGFMMWPYILGIVMELFVSCVWLHLLIKRPQFKACALLALATVFPIARSVVRAINSYHNIQTGLTHPSWIISFSKISPHLSLLTWLFSICGLIWLTISIIKQTEKK